MIDESMLLRLTARSNMILTSTGLKRFPDYVQLQKEILIFKQAEKLLKENFTKRQDHDNDGDCLESSLQSWFLVLHYTKLH